MAAPPVAMLRPIRQGEWTMIRKLLFAGAAAALLYAAPVAAQAPQANDYPDDRTTFEFFSPEAINASLSPFNVKAEAQTTGGMTYVSFDLDGLRYYILITACLENDPRRCVGANMFLAFDRKPGMSAQELNSKIQSFNSLYAFTKVYIDEQSGRLILSRYMVSDYGKSRGQVRQEVASFVSIAASFRKEFGL